MKPKVNKLQKHQDFVNCVNSIKQEIKGKILPTEVYQITGETLIKITAYANWVNEFIKDRKRSIKSAAKSNGRKRKPVSEISFDAYVRRLHRDHQKLHPKVTFAEFTGGTTGHFLKDYWAAGGKN